MKITYKLILLQASNQAYNSTRSFTQPQNYVMIKRGVRLRAQATNARNYMYSSSYFRPIQRRMTDRW